MPSKSDKQRRLFGTALSMKRGESSKTNTPAGKIADTVSESKIQDFAKKSSDKPNDEKIAWEHLTPLQQAQIKHTRPDLFVEKTFEEAPRDRDMSEMDDYKEEQWIKAHPRHRDETGDWYRGNEREKDKDIEKSVTDKIDSFINKYTPEEFAEHDYDLKFEETPKHSTKQPKHHKISSAEIGRDMVSEGIKKEDLSMGNKPKMDLHTIFHVSTKPNPPPQIKSGGKKKFIMNSNDELDERNWSLEKRKRIEQFDVAQAKENREETRKRQGGIKSKLDKEGERDMAKEIKKSLPFHRKEQSLRDLYGPTGDIVRVKVPEGKDYLQAPKAGHYFTTREIAQREGLEIKPHKIRNSASELFKRLEKSKPFKTTYGTAGGGSISAMARYNTEEEIKEAKKESRRRAKMTPESRELEDHKNDSIWGPQPEKCEKSKDETWYDVQKSGVVKMDINK
jgi:hypothetical protein